MDNTETYIRMSDCEEIQGQRPSHGSPEDLGSEHGFYDREDEIQATRVWLPRQDQLQEMMTIDHPYTSLKLLSALAQFCSVDNLKNLGQWLSMEQLWLAFVMKKKYNKVWDGKSWTKGDKDV